jgi:hypothetical protein
MFQRKLFLGGVSFGSLSVLLLAASASSGQVRPKSEEDLIKIGKIEKAAETVVAKASSTVPADSNFVNPRVRPGLVKWRPSLKAACQAAQKSGKPVLLFQMMGKFDDQFC